MLVQYNPLWRMTDNWDILKTSASRQTWGKYMFLGESLRKLKDIPWNRQRQYLYVVDVLCPIPGAIYLQSRSLYWTPLHNFFLNRIPSYNINQNITSFSELRVAQNKLWSTWPILISFPLCYKYTLCNSNGKEHFIKGLIKLPGKMIQMKGIRKSNPLHRPYTSSLPATSLTKRDSYSQNQRKISQKYANEGTPPSFKDLF